MSAKTASFSRPVCLFIRLLINCSTLGQSIFGKEVVDYDLKTVHLISERCLLRVINIGKEVVSFRFHILRPYLTICFENLHGLFSD